MKILAGLISLVGAFWLFFAGIAFEHRPAGWPNVDIRLPLGLHWTLHLPDSPVAALKKQDAAELAAAQRSQRVVTRTIVVTQQAEAHEVAAQAQIRTVTSTVIKEVPTYVTPQIDRRFPLSVGFVRVLDAGALGVDVSAVPGPAGLADDAASPLAPSLAAAGAVDDFGRCRASAERLTALQAWVTAQQGAFRGP